MQVIIGCLSSEKNSIIGPVWTLVSAKVIRIVPSVNQVMLAKDVRNIQRITITWNRLLQDIRYMYRLKFKDENTRTLTIIIFNVLSSLGRSGRQIQHPRDPVLISSVSQTNVSFELLTPVEFYLLDFDVESLIRIRVFTRCHYVHYVAFYNRAPLLIDQRSLQIQSFNTISKEVGWGTTHAFHYSCRRENSLSNSMDSETILKLNPLKKWITSTVWMN